MQGFNMGRYVPPDVEGTTSGNRLHGKHALGARASKLASHGALTVRFELPFAVWCASCPKPTVIGQGVRFNAQKRRVGSYFSTPVWAFRFRHADCGGDIEVRTDPRNTAYVVVEGGAKRDTGEDQRPGAEAGAAILTDQEREALRKNAFAKLEKTIADREQLKLATERIDDLAEASARHWDDPYTQNQKLRRTFRAERKKRESTVVAAEGLKDRMSLGIDLLPATDEDARHAALIDFGAADDDAARDRALSKPLFGSGSSSGKKDKSKASSKVAMLKSEKEASRRKESLVSEVIGNTRAAQDPFLRDPRAGEPKPSARLPGVKRKRTLHEDAAPAPKVLVQEAGVSTGLVNYDSDE